MELQYAVQNYKWGKKGISSKVGLLLKNADAENVVDEDTHYAELWLGTHPNGPSKLKTNGKLLGNIISEHPEYLGQNVIKQFGMDLPFLFKVLSVNEALSIQVHPSKKFAEELHQKQPEKYKDPNHKPELAIALTSFQALCGFRPLAEIKKFLQDIPELAVVIEKAKVEALLESNIGNCIEPLKHCFHALMNCKADTVTEEITNLLKRLQNESNCIKEEQLFELLAKLNTQFPNDVGCFCVYFFNVISLKPFDAIYLPANEPHAYISGDCIECMACSDNVVRAGLTPKFKDVETLCTMLNYKGQAACAKFFKPKKEDDFTDIFQPPVPDFAVAKIEVPLAANSYTLIKRNTASILLVIKGTASLGDIALRDGKALFIPANEIANITGISADLLMFQALANV